MDAEVILKRFRSREQGEGKGGPSALAEGDWRQMERLLRSAVTDTATKASRSLSQTLHHLQVQNKLLHYENDGLREALTIKRRRKKRSKQLNLQQRKEYHAGAIF